MTHEIPVVISRRGMRSMALSRHDGPLCPGSSGSYGAARLGGGESLSMGHGALGTMVGSWAPYSACSA